MKLYRQGDVLLKSIESLPKGVTKNDSKVLAYGEVTGHSHRFEGEGVVTYGNPIQYIDVQMPSPLIHEEHKEVIILPGIYEVLHEREWDYIDKEMKKVVD